MLLQVSYVYIVMQYSSEYEVMYIIVMRYRSEYEASLSLTSEAVFMGLFIYQYPDPSCKARQCHYSIPGS